MRWSSLKNGELLAKVAEQFDVFITVDNGIKYQQNNAKYEIAVVILRSRGSTFDALRPIVPALQEVLETITKGEVITISDRS